MRKAIVAIALSAASIAFGFVVAGAAGAPAAAETNGTDAVGDASGFSQVQEESPDPDTNRERNGTRDHNCPDRDGDGEPDAPEDSETSLDQV